MELKSKLTYKRFKTESLTPKGLSKGLKPTEKLDFHAFSGGKHVVNSAFQLKKWSLIESYLKSESNTAQSDFLEINFKCVMITKN
jgi:hypothetical protein